MEGLQELDQSVEILIRLLCALPGWSEKNVQVFKDFAFAVQQICLFSFSFSVQKILKHLVGTMQVQQQVIEVITYIASTATKFPKKCVVLCLLGGFSYILNSQLASWLASPHFF